MRRIVEKLVQNSKVRRRLPKEFGARPILVSGDSALSYLKVDWARSHSDLLNACWKYIEKDSTVWDIGANLGVFSLAAAHLVGSAGEVLAVEPDPFLSSLINQTSRLNKNSSLNIRTLTAGISNYEGISQLLIAARGRSSNALMDSGHRSQAGGTRFVADVVVLSLDSLLKSFKAPDFIKIDIEGNEVNALLGATRLLRDIRPSFYIEVGKDQSSEISKIFRAADYRLFDGDKSDEIEIEQCSFNVFACPIESTSTNKGLR